MLYFICTNYTFRNDFYSNKCQYYFDNFISEILYLLYVRKVLLIKLNVYF